jgi:hypothetical protein
VTDDDTANSIGVLHDLRRRRKRHRLGDIEWFDAAYRAYLIGGFGGGTVIWISTSVDNTQVAASTAASIAKHGPAVVGMLAIVAALAGLRGGAQGGPLALESADVAYVMLSPVDRARALLRPAVQRVRSAAWLWAVLGAIVGQLFGRRLPGSPVAWAFSGAAFGVTVGLLWAGLALLAHNVHLRQWVATAIGLALVAWQAAAIAWNIPGPGDRAGSLAMWGWRQHTADLVAPAVAVAAVVVGMSMLRRTSLDALARRSSLVAQLRFAVTMQDLRTVILLRRQLNQEHSRGRPWLRVPAWLTPPVPRRGAASISRFPAARLIRMTAIAALVGVSEAFAARGAVPLIAVSGLLMFVLGLEAFEPLAQEIDQPDRTDSLPIERGELLVRHLVVPAIALVPFAAVAWAAAVLTLHTSTALLPAAIIAVPGLLAGVAGGVVSIVRDAPDPTSSSQQQAFIPPEMAGISSAFRIGLPLIVSTLATLPVIFVRIAVVHDTSLIAAAVRGVVGVLLLIFFVQLWVRRRDRWRRSFRRFMDDGRAYSRGQRSTA